MREFYLCWTGTNYRVNRDLDLWSRLDDKISEVADDEYNDVDLCFLHVRGKSVRDFACSGPLDKLADNMQWAPTLSNSKVPDKPSVVCMI